MTTAAIDKPYALFSILQWWIDLFETDWQSEGNRK
jgi:hypothetical protein